MKTIGIKNIYNTALFIIGISVIVSCSNNSKIKGSQDFSDETDKSYNARKEKDTHFLITAAEINIEEIHLGQLAQRKSLRTDVKLLGKKLEKRNSLCLNGLNALAMEKTILIPITPTDMAFDIYKDLNQKSGMTFDKEYCERMLNEYQNTIFMFEEASVSSSDADIREWANSMLPELRNHLDYIINCQKRIVNI